MTILITGATGLVGERLVPRLVEAGFTCRVLLRPGKRAPANVEVVTGDILDVSTLEQAAQGLSAVIHLAAVFRTQDMDMIWKSNLDGTRNLIAAIKAHAPEARFIMASTAHVYSIDNSHPGREDDVVNPQHAYPASKLAAERELRASGLTWAVLRFPFVYGDGDGHLEALPGHIGTWHPAQRMSTIHHQDIATAMHMALDGAMDGRVVNIADDATMSVYELVGVTGAKVPSSSVPLPNPWYLTMDVSLARSLGFTPVVSTVYEAQRNGLI
ncbi:NAD-dependent epimerase/dehydratase family protein [Rhizobium terrae]|uniref:NAD-dependent epimerase/dehydratase family protein n=1 Tax=Rhizobium terrae TaxID=2171756 RepID=UPI000E3EA31B|nr:NAD(P)-dependent oxidoreductase [Rhizobium terrae]